MNDNTQKRSTLLTSDQWPLEITFIGGVTVKSTDADKHIRTAYGKPTVGYVIRAAGDSGSPIFAAVVPNVDKDEDGYWERDGFSINWHSTFKGASKAVKAGYRLVDKIVEYDGDEFDCYDENDEDDLEEAA